MHISVRGHQRSSRSMQEILVPKSRQEEQRPSRKAFTCCSTFNAEAMSKVYVGEVLLPMIVYCLLYV